jgi:predicted N-acetyltransferase YhbS
MAIITLRHERTADIPAREALLDEAFGAVARRRKTCEQLREGRLPAEGLSLVASEGRRLIGTARLWPVACAPSVSALLLGPVAVTAACRNRGIGAALIARALREARRLGHGAVMLVGDATYYGRFGFSSVKTQGLHLPGPFERERLLALELKPTTLDGARGLIRASGLADTGLHAAAA